jgi:hypothetical protein
VILANGRHRGDFGAQLEPVHRLGVFSELNAVWRVSALIPNDDKALAIWATGDDSGMQLYAGRLGPGRSVQGAANTPDRTSSDVTEQTVLLTEGTPQFDKGTATLRACLALGNRGEDTLRVPIRLEAGDLGSPLGKVSILNASNGMTERGAVWDISQAITGDRLPPHTDSNPFCLSFHVETNAKSALVPRASAVLNLSVRVFAQR